MQSFITVLIFSFIFYRFFLSIDPLIANDWPLLFEESRIFHPFWSIAWDYMGQGGIGGPAFKTLWIDLYTNFVYFVSNSINLPWFLSQRIFWILPFLALSVFSSYKFSSLFIKSDLLKGISPVIYSFNTYILLIVAGGQFGIAFSYALAPLVLLSFINLSKNLNTKNLILHGLIFGIILALDPRIAFLVLLVEMFWFMVFVRNFKKLYLFLLSFFIAFLINLYWLLPLILFRNSSPIFSGYTSLEGVNFLSFAKFENSLSLLHPNWPENIFGKVSFMKPEFLIIPIFAFGTLLLKIKKEILFFAILSLIGVFLGKGTNEPFGVIYSTLFQYIPGFNLFRDSTKFFIFVVLSYSILIPYFLENFKKFKYLLIGVFIIYWLFTLKPAWSGELTGIFKPKQIPHEYILLNKNIEKDSSFYRTLWIPKRQKYGFFSPSHPAADSEILFKNTDIGESRLRDLGIKYVIIPYDLEGEIFLDDRKYSEKLYLETLERVENAKWLRKVEGFGKIVVFEVPNPKDHFYIQRTEDRGRKTEGVSYKFVNPTKYSGMLKNVKEGDILVFSEGYDKNWSIESSKFKVQSSPFRQGSNGQAKFDGGVNSFILPKDGNYEFRVYYEPQRLVNIGLVISGAALVFIGWFIVRGSRKI